MSEAAQLAEIIKNDVKSEIAELSGDLREMAQAVTEVTKSVNTLVTQTTLAEERHSRQREENQRIHERCDKLETTVDDMQKDFAAEKLLNGLLRKRLGWAAGILMTMLMGGLVSGAWFVIKAMAIAQAAAQTGVTP